ncbi:hypothetical protein [Nitrosomonas sp.]|uniref:hypothetical protein n=1 Tax=Nitrosomonas sp. TaxID=42353 RepID=UPI0025D41034|nr:hypothetical protein [Nitrosomonas sp.]
MSGDMIILKNARDIKKNPSIETLHAPFAARPSSIKSGSIPVINSPSDSTIQMIQSGLVSKANPAIRDTAKLANIGFAVTEIRPKKIAKGMLISAITKDKL